MRAGLRAGRFGVTAALMAVALAGCGGGGDDKKSAAKESEPAAETAETAQTADPAGGDVAGEAKQARTDARNAVSLVETCYVDAMDYSACADPQMLTDGGLTPGSEGGQVEVTDATATAYTVSAYTSDGSWFSVEKSDDGSSARSCDAVAEAGCNDGTW